MLPVIKGRTLPLPDYTAERVAELGKSGYAFTPAQVNGLTLKWLTPPGWTRAAELPPKGSDGFTPVLGFMHRDTGAVAALRYSQAAFDFDPGDFIDAADPHTYSEATSYALHGMMVAERGGQKDANTFIATALHRRGPHVLLASCEWAKAHHEELLPAVTAFNTGILLDGEHPRLAELYRTHTVAPLGIQLRAPERAEVTPSDHAVTVRTPYGAHTGEITITAVTGAKLATAMNLAVINLSKVHGKPSQATVRKANLQLPWNEAGPRQLDVHSMELGNESECTVVAAPLGPSHTFLVQALYPSRKAHTNAWLSARFTTGLLATSLELI